VGSSLVVQRGLSAVDDLLTGFHEPKSNHRAVLASREVLQQRYLWREFGDLHMYIPID
jgi:S-adenosylmethionine:tRNA ribosyltransferase-isomerase